MKSMPKTIHPVLVGGFLLTLTLLLASENDVAANTTRVQNTAPPSASPSMSNGAVVQFSIPLRPGWNLISVPGEPVDNAINAVFSLADIQQVVTTANTQGLSSSPLSCSFIATLGPECLKAERVGGLLTGSLTTFMRDRAYWVQTISFAPLTIDIVSLSRENVRG